MLSKSLTGPARYILLSYLASQALAQTYTSCNPLSQTCDAAPALSGTLITDFTTGSSNRYEAYLTSNQVSYSDIDGATFTIAEQGDSPTVESDFFIMFGYLEFVAQAAPGQGIVSSMVLISDDLDEIDIEWVGGDTTQVQSNYFSKGDTSTYDRGAYHPVTSPQATMNTYAIDWTSERIIWYVNGVAVRTLENPGTGYYPQSPMQVRFGSWAGGDSGNSAGTIEWAGGLTDYSAAPFNFYVQSVHVQDYSTGTDYEYSDHSGAWTSIMAVDGEINGNLDGTAAEVSADVSSASVSTSSAGYLASVGSLSSSSSSSSSSTFSGSSSSPQSTLYSVYSSPASSSSSSSQDVLAVSPSSLTYVASSTARRASTEAFSAEPAITTLVAKSTTGPETSFVITTLWDADSATVANSISFEFSEQADSSASATAAVTDVNKVFISNFYSKNTDKNTTTNSTTTTSSHVDQSNDSMALKTLSTALVLYLVFMCSILF